MKILGYEPTQILAVVNAAVALLVSFGLHLTVAQTGAVTTIATAVLAIVTAVMTRPFVVSALTGALQTLLTAAVVFGLPLSGDQIGAFVAFLSLVLGLLLRQNVTPAAKVRA